MRLAFSVAINVDASVLLIDEILAVGDATFQAKCFNRLREIKANGTTIVIVSHSLTQIEQFCDRSIWINNGKIAMEGLPREVHPAYLDYMSTMHGVGSSHETLPPESEPHDGSEASRTPSAADEAATGSRIQNPFRNRKSPKNNCAGVTKILKLSVHICLMKKENAQQS